MDVGKDGSHLQLLRTPETHPQRARTAEVIGTWSLRNRDELRKRRAEVQEKQTSQWLLGEQKKRKYQRTGKRNPRGQKRLSITEKTEPQSQTGKQRMQKVLVEETECPVNPVSETLPLVAFPPEAVTAEHCAEAHQESIQCQDVAIQNHPQAHKLRAKPEDLSPNMCQEIDVLQHCSNMCRDMAEPEALSSGMCQETAMPLNHSSKAPQDMAGPEVLSPEVCQQPAVLEEHPLEMCEDVARPEVLSPKIHQEMAVVPWSTPGDAAGPEGCSPEALPQSDVPEGYPLDTCPRSVTPEKTISQADQRMAVTEGCFPETRECTVSEDISTKTHQEAVEPEFMSHKIHKLTEPTVSSHKITQDSPGPGEYSPEICQPSLGPRECSPETCQPSPGPGEYSPETCQPSPGLENHLPESCHEMPGPEDLSIKTYENKDGPNPCLLEQSQEAEIKEDAKADQDPETPSSPQGPQEICPDNDNCSYVLF
ncbi:hemogen [Phodopus roborovskii]|uniref:hemogen n=1 Tax=Phodopus roborovskii TaxID=109678 RepID=UPI0021E36EB0|nr:hemogen [Phodopus roborovskii]